MGKREHQSFIIVMVMLLALAVLGAVTGASSRHGPWHPHPSPSPTQTVPTPSNTSGIQPPSGYTLRYSRDFAHTPGLGDWVVQPGAGAQVQDSTAAGAQFGMGVGMNALSQWAEIISSSAVITPDTMVKALMYIPGASGTRPAPDAATFPAGSTANWPAWWTFGNPWPQNGEIDIMEAQSGQSCLQTHYSSGPSSSTELNSPSFCGPVNAGNNGVSTGWVEISMLRTGEQVQVWYGSTFIGTVTLPTTANEKLVFQNQSYSTSVCGHCFGPTLLGPKSTSWISNVQVWSK